MQSKARIPSLVFLLSVSLLAVFFIFGISCQDGDISSSTADAGNIILVKIIESEFDSLETELMMGKDFLILESILDLLWVGFPEEFSLTVTLGDSVIFQNVIAKSSCGGGSVDLPTTIIVKNVFAIDNDFINRFNSHIPVSFIPSAQACAPSYSANLNHRKTLVYLGVFP